MLSAFRGEWYTITAEMKTAHSNYKKKRSQDMLEAYRATVNSAEAYVEKKLKKNFLGQENKETTDRREEIQTHRKNIKIAEFQMLLDIAKLKGKKYKETQTSENLTAWHLAIQEASSFQQTHSEMMEDNAQAAVHRELGSYTQEKTTYDHKNSLATQFSDGVAKVNKSPFWRCCTEEQEEVEAIPLNDLGDDSSTSYEPLSSHAEFQKRRQIAQQKSEEIRQKWGMRR